jgi:predicted nucleotidyltransferase
MTLIKTPEVTTSEAINMLRRAVVSSLDDEVLRMIFFGSRRKGIFSPDSDIDVLIILRHKRRESINRIFEIGNMVEQDILHYEIPLTIHIISDEEYRRFKVSKSPFILSIEKEGMVIYERTPQS